MSTHSSDRTLAEFGGGLDDDSQRTIVPASELRGEYDAERVHEVADEVSRVIDAAEALNVKFEDAKHDIRKVDRYGDFASAQDIVEKLRQAEDEAETDERYAQYKRGGQ